MRHKIGIRLPRIARRHLDLFILLFDGGWLIVGCGGILCFYRKAEFKSEFIA
jgi:hypothetical protein